MKKLTWTYLASYLVVGGLGFSVAPELTLKLFFSNGEYGEIMPRITGMFMLALGGLIATMTYNNDFRYYSYAVFIRTAMTGFIGWLYFLSKDPMMLVIIGIILLGLVPAWYLYLKRAD